MSQAVLLEALPPAARKHLDPASPMPPRMMAAKGLVPLPPRDSIVVLAGLTLDADAKLAETAQATLANLPDKLASAALGLELPPPALGVLARAFVTRDALLERVIVNRATPDDDIAAIAPQVSEGIAEIILNNQERCLRSEPLVRAIRTNPNALRSSIDRLFDFLVRSGVIYDDLQESAESLGRLSPTEAQQMAEQIPIPEELHFFLAEPAHEAVTDRQSETDNEDTASADEPIPDTSDAEDEEATENEEGRVPLQKLINSLNSAQKIALATRGNKEARTILLRDPNKLVCTSVIRSPRITEPEVVAAAKSRSVNEEVIRIIANSKDMTRAYNVKVALVNNPKTPLAVSLRYLTLMKQTDLRSLSQSKGIPTALATQARNLLRQRTGG